MRKILLSTILFCNYFICFSQFTQTIRGEVVDKNTGLPLLGATVTLMNTNPVIGVVTDENGIFKISKIPVGRQGIQINSMGYKPVTLPALYLESGKEIVLHIELEEDIIQVEEVVVKANARKGKPLNDMAIISARSFTVEETEKYAGSWGDPSRMAMNFAGVMTGSDQVNGIIIRGNSPNGLQFRLDGIPIPNPNHFGSLGATSGPISMLNNNVLANSDFYTSAFTAQYGNATSGIFNLGLRTGNNEKREYLGQIGFNGYELGAEGPFSSKSKASYIINYRYSTMGVLDALGIDIGVGAIPYYQDLAFKIDIPGTKLGRFSLFGMGGKNNIEFKEDENDSVLYVESASKMGVGGLSHLIYLSENTRLKTTFATTYYESGVFDTISYSGIRETWYGDEFSEWKLIGSAELKTKLNTRNTLIAGASVENIHLDYLDSVWLEPPNDMFIHNFQTDGKMNLYQSYLQWQHRFRNITIVSGVHYQMTDLNDEYMVEPRVSMEYEFLPGKSFTLGYGLHSRVQPGLIYFQKTLVDTTNGVYTQTNKDLGFSKSHQFVAGYNHRFNSNLRLKVETYYQYLYDVPVKNYPSMFSMINYESGYYDFTYDSLINEGLGRNLGLEITFERSLSENYYYLITVSVFDSKYKATDNDTWKNTAFNGNYVVNALGGYEFTISKKNTLSIDAKGVLAGGMRSIPIDVEASITKDETVLDNANAYKTRFDDYYKIDLRIAYKLNMKRISMEWALDITNLTNHKNRFFEFYDKVENEVVQAGQMGIVPIMLYRIHF